MCGRWRGAWAHAGWRVWDLGNGTIMLQKLFNYFQIFPPLVFSYRLFIFTNRGNFQVRTWVWRKFAASIFKEGIGQESNGAANQEKQIFLLCSTLPDLAFGFVHKRSGNEIIWYLVRIWFCMDFKHDFKLPQVFLFTSFRTFEDHTGYHFPFWRIDQLPFIFQCLVTFIVEADNLQHFKSKLKLYLNI